MVLPKRRPAKSRKRNGQQQFVAAWLRSPLRVGAIMPSSRGLAKAMAACIDVKRPGLVIELGAGTGVVTQALLDAGVSPVQLLVVEREPELHNLLQAQFPDAHVVCGDAMHLGDLLEQMGRPCVSAIVSSLPMLSLPKAVKQAIQQQMAGLAGENGVIVQFTYGARSPLNRTEFRKHRISGKRVKTVLANVPPAHIWLYKKEAGA